MARTIPTRSTGSQGGDARRALGTCRHAGTPTVWALALAGLAAGPDVIRAQDADLAGTWRAGETTMQVQVESWGPDCGPRPTSSRSRGGGSVEIARDGQNVVIRGRSHVVRTDQCWSQNPAMHRQSSAFRDGTWTTVCKTPDSDARAESGTYTLRMQDDATLSYRDVSRYNWKLKASACVATITTVQQLVRDGAAASRPAPVRVEHADEGLPSDPKCVPGVPAKLTLRPAQATVELGGRACFKAIVLDKDGCPVPGASVAYNLTHEPGLSARLAQGCFEASSSAAEAEGEYRITARAGSLRASAKVSVRTLDLSGLIAMRLETGGLTGFESAQAPTPEAKPATRISTGPAQQGNEGADTQRLVGTVAGVAAVLVLLGVWLATRRKAAETELSAADRNARSTGPTQPAEPAPPDETWICPTCRHGYPAASRTCPNCPQGRNVLIPYAEFNRRAQQKQAGTKRCRACGADVLASANFCGQCGSRDLSGVDQ